MSTKPTLEGAKRQSPWTPKRIILGVILAYGLILVLANRNTVSVNFVFFRTEASLFVVLLLAIALGFVVGWLFDDLRDRRRRRREPRRGEAHASPARGRRYARLATGAATLRVAPTEARRAERRPRRSARASRS